MSSADSMERLRKSFSVSNLDPNNPGSWPLPIKVIACIFLFAAISFGGYQILLKDLQVQLEREAVQELSLKEQYSKKAFDAANLEAYKQQLVEMEESFGAMLRQLPTDTEVPGLLEDVSKTGLGSGLEFEEIKLQPEVIQQFYIELPIQIKAVGGYHELATFISGVAGLPRIVTLHNFELAPVSADSSSKLRLSVLAKTYRYNDKGVQK